MNKTLIKQNNAVEVVFREGDNDNKHYEIKGAKTNIFYHHHLGRYQGDKRNPDWERVTICVYKKLAKDADPYEEMLKGSLTLGRYQFDGIGCVDQANKKLKQLIK